MITVTWNDFGRKSLAIHISRHFIKHFSIAGSLLQILFRLRAALTQRAFYLRCTLRARNKRIYNYFLLRIASLHVTYKEFYVGEVNKDETSRPTFVSYHWLWRQTSKCGQFRGGSECTRNFQPMKINKYIRDIVVHWITALSKFEHLIVHLHTCVSMWTRDYACLPWFCFYVLFDIHI